MAIMQYTVTEKVDGVWTTTTHQMEESPGMAAAREAMVAFDKAHPGFWCSCGNPQTGNIVPRGHSLDVDCRNCGGMLQVG